MVSNVLDMTALELAALLAEFRVRYADDAEYQERRRELPPEWPM